MRLVVDSGVDVSETNESNNSATDVIEIASPGGSGLDEPNDTFDLATELDFSTGANIPGKSLSTGSDVDVYHFTASESGELGLFTNGNVGHVITVYDHDLQAIGESSSIGFSITAAAAYVIEGNSYFIEVSSGDGSPVSEYSFSQTLIGLAKVSVSNAAVTEGNSGEVLLTFDLAFDGVPTGPIGNQQQSIRYRTFEEFATGGVDYLDVSGTIEFTRNATDVSVSVPVFADTIAEGGGSLFIELFDASNILVGKEIAVGTILNDDDSSYPTDATDLDNNDIAGAEAIHGMPVAILGRTIHAFEDSGDLFRWTPTDSGLAHVELTFDHDYGDMDLMVFNSVLENSPESPPIAQSVTGGDSESVAFNVIADTTYFIWAVPRGDDLSPAYALRVLDAGLLDFGDAPSPYPTTLLEDGARHVAIGPMLGAARDGEADGIHSSDASADNGVGTNDEDGVLVVSSMLATGATTTISSFAVFSSQAGKLDAWIDFNQDGDWDDLGEQIAGSIDIAKDLNHFGFNVPDGAKPGVTGARFRLSSGGGLGPTGVAPDGEVEDYIVTILNGTAHGDANISIDPPSSGTLDVIADGDEIVARRGTIELFRGLGSKLNRLDVSGTDGDDTLNVANLNAIFGGQIRFDGREGNDTLNLTGGGQTLDLAQIADDALHNIEAINISGSGDNILSLNLSGLLNISPASDTLKVRHDERDTLVYGDGWTAEIPQIIDNEFSHVFTQRGATVQVANTLPFQNPLLLLDTNRDGSVSPLDALIVINRLNMTGSEQLLTPTTASELSAFFYIDTNGDRFVAPADVIQIINSLNNPTINAESEYVSAPLVLPSAHTSDAGDLSLTTNTRRDNYTLVLTISAAANNPRAVACQDTVYSRGRRKGVLADGIGKEELLAAIDAYFDVL